MRTRVLPWLALSLLIAAPELHAGVVLERVGSRSALETAGLRPGDLLLRWDGGEIRDVFDWIWLEMEQAPRGTVVLHGEREGEAVSWTVAPGRWEGAEARPWLPADALAIYQDGRRLVADGAAEAGVAKWESLLARRDLPAGAGVWLRSRIGRAWASARDWEKAEASLRAAIGEAPSLRAQAELWGELGETLRLAADLPRRVESLRTAADLARAADGEGLSWANRLSALGAALGDLGSDLAVETLETALRVQERLSPDGLALLPSLWSLAKLAYVRGDPGQAFRFDERSLEIADRLDPEGLWPARISANMALSVFPRGEFARSLALARRAVALLEALAPESEDFAEALVRLGTSEFLNHQFESSEIHLQRAYGLYGKIAPGTLEAAMPLGEMGMLAIFRQDSAGAAQYFRQALGRYEALAPENEAVPGFIQSLGFTEFDLGDLELAEETLLRSNRLIEARTPRSLGIANNLMYLGEIYRQRGELDLAEQSLERALEIYRELAPGLGLGIASLRLAQVAQDRGDYDRAIQILKQRVDQWAAAPPEAPALVERAELVTAVLARWKGDLSHARASFQKLLVQAAERTPGTLLEARMAQELGRVAFQTGDLETAEASFERSLALHSRLAPGTGGEATSFEGLAKISLERRQPEAAVAYLRRSIDALESQIGKLGGSEEGRASFRSGKGAVYRLLIDLLVDQGRSAEAFAVSERFRGRSFLNLLAEKSALAEIDVPRDLALARRALAKEYDGVQWQLVRSKTPEEGQALTARLQELRARHDEVVAQIRQASPRVAALRYARPLGLEGAERALDPGTALLSYIVGEERTQLFILAPGRPPAVRTLPAGETELRQMVGDFLGRIAEARPGSPLGEVRLAQMRESGRRLYDLLIAPAEAEIGAAGRLLFVPDGPLHRLPWGALVRPGEAGASQGEYLAAWKPFHLALSATVYREILSRRSDGDTAGRGELVAFGDPVFPASFRQEGGGGKEIGDARVRAAARRGFRFAPLPDSRDEVLRIARLYPDSARTYLGTEATEEHAKEAAPSARYLHFATHASLDERMPLNSAVVLSLPERFQEGRENGLLQAWEIFDGLRIDASLVVLSACESGLGRELGGEGLIGLTRAFQYAGARSVMASLWQVSDAATEELMVRFYRHLRAGKSKDQALQAAQIELLRNPPGGRAPAPVSWAAFQVYGDWR